MKVKSFFTTVLILIGGIVLTSLPRASAQREQSLSAEEPKLLQVAAKREGLDASQLQMLKSTTVELPLTGRKVQTAKIFNPENGQSFAASIDDQGQEVEFATLKAEEQRRRTRRWSTRPTWAEAEMTLAMALRLTRPATHT